MIREIYLRNIEDPNYESNILEHSNDVESIIQQIKIILGTEYGQVLGDNKFGVNLKKLVFQTKLPKQKIEQLIQEQDLLNKHKLLLIFLEDMEVDPGLRGLIANKLMAKYQRPVALLLPIVIEQNGEKIKAWSGSARGYENSQLKDFRQFCRDSNLVFLAEGHANAFGLGIYDLDLSSFISWSEEQLQNMEFIPSYYVDFIYSAHDTEATRTILSLGELKYLWGQNIAEPNLALENVNVTKDMITLMSRDKNPTLKISNIS